jgi:hypothetical protein
VCTVRGCGQSFGFKHVLQRHHKNIHIDGKVCRTTLYPPIPVPFPQGVICTFYSFGFISEQEVRVLQFDALKPCVTIVILVVLYRVSIHCFVLYFIVLSCIALYCIILLAESILFSNISFYDILLNHSILYFLVNLFYRTSYYTILFFYDTWLLHIVVRNSFPFK